VIRARERGDELSAVGTVVPRWRGAVAGAMAAAAALSVGAFVSGLVRGTTSPVVSVGSWIIDHVPPTVKEFAIRTFGSNDKNALIVGTTIALVAFAVVIGLLARRRRWIGFAGCAVFGAIGVAAALVHVNSRLIDAVPSVLGAVTAGAVIDVLVRTRPTLVTPTPAVIAADRRRFLIQLGAVAASAALFDVAGSALRRRFSVATARAEITLPTATTPAETVPAGIDPDVAGITAFTTANRDFYRVDTALVVPQVDPGTWRLRVHGMVDKELSFSLDDLLSRPLVERDLTLVCVSNEVGGTYAGNARWLGVPLRDILDEAGVRNGADQLVSRSVDGWTAGTPVAATRDGRDALIALGMNGEPLPVEHGFPARLVVPGLYGFVSATKWVTSLELTTFDAFNGYWVRRGWAQQAPVKTMSRIDTPRGLQRVGAGRVPIGGVAWATHRGISKVEVRIDDGPWQEAQLAPVPSVDTWRQWFISWDAPAGSHTVTCRATDSTGQTQDQQRVDPIPDGATGWHQIVVLVS
jgi:DMSO/TMAO reductase YedYZ molybdopterin-dependent catalytic subunit